MRRFTKEEFSETALALTAKAAASALSEGDVGMANSISIAGAAITALFEHYLFESEEEIEIITDKE